jgi:hypothetical protein
MAFQDFLIGLLILLVGAAFCFVGYRFFRILIAIWGFFAGFELGAAGMTALFGQNFLGTTTGWVLGFVIGVVLALLAYFFYYIAVVLLGASIGYSIGTGLMAAIGLNPSGFVSVIVGIVVAVLLALIIQPAKTPDYAFHSHRRGSSHPVWCLDPLWTDTCSKFAIWDRSCRHQGIVVLEHRLDSIGNTWFCDTVAHHARVYPGVV